MKKAVHSAAVVLALVGTMTLAVLSFGGEAQAQKSKKPASSQKALIAQGKKVYEANGCVACHKIGAKGGPMGPELTQVGKERKAAWLSAQVRDPKKNNPDAKMPAYGPDKINEKDLKALVAYLGSLK